ncbi:MAG: NUDIX hydrolase [Wenzhouxiangellaceae bacterium]
MTETTTNDPVSDSPATDICYRGEFLNFARRGRWEFATRLHNHEVAVIIAVTPANELVLVEQHRIPVNRPTIELPAGLIGDTCQHRGESAMHAAARELEEETGYRTGCMRQIMKTPTSAGLTDETAVFFTARGLQQVSSGGGDDTEEIIVHRVPLEEVGVWLRAQYAAGKAIDPKIYSALYWLEHPEAIA